jgi:hypothetical protein
MAAEGAHMKSSEPSPPRWAEAMLRSLLRPSDLESISGDLLEEYRAAKHPLLGAIRANVWYVKQVVSVLWRLIRPSVLAMAGLALLSLTVTIPWNVRLVPAPGISLLDALIYLWAGYRGSHRTRLIKTGPTAAGVTSFVGFAVTFAFLAIRAPGLVIVALSKPFIVVILSLLLLQALSYGVLLGFLGGVIGMCGTSIASREVRVS